MFPTAITYAYLSATFWKGLRNGSWRRLRFLDKALFRDAMGYAKHGGSIVNGKLVEKHFFQKEIFTKETILNYFIHFICKYKNKIMDKGKCDTNMKHECCGTAEKVWLPYELEGRSRGLVPHSYCIHCGVVNQKIQQSERGYYKSIFLVSG
jgi:hypothetical protein